MKNLNKEKEFVSPIEKFQKDLGIAMADSVNKSELIEIFKKRLIHNQLQKLMKFK